MNLRLVVFLLLVVALVVPTRLPVQAQDDGKPTPIDNYPLPGEPGAARYSLVDRWDWTDLTYFFHNCPSTMPCSTAYVEVRRAFQSWADVSALTFTEVDGAALADIEVRWAIGEEELGVPGGVLAFAYFPSFGGDLYFDDAELWTTSTRGTNLFAVAVHEIGHAIGLDHTDDQSAIMFPYAGYAIALGQDDIDGVQRLYGPNTDSDPDVVVADSDPDTLPTNESIETVEGHINNQQYYELWTIDARAQETITFTMEALSGSLDSYLGLLTPDQSSVLAEDDNGMGGTDAQITFTFPSAGSYVIVTTRRGLDEGTSSGTYRLTAYRNQSTAPPTPTEPPATTTVTLTLNNNSGAVLCSVWISPTVDSDWGSDQLNALGVPSLQANQTAQWEVAPDAYDIRVMDCFGTTVERYLVPVLTDTTLQVTASTITVR